MEIKNNLTLINFSDKNNVGRIKKIVIHYFGALGTAKETCAFFYNVYRGASASYFVDESEIWRCVTDEDTAWHCGEDGVGTQKNIVFNSNSIGIEMRPLKVNTTTMGAGDTDWYFNDKTLQNTRDIVVSLMQQYNLTIDDVVRHYDVTGKACPRPFTGNDVNTYYNKTGNALWAEFKAFISAGLEAANNPTPIVEEEEELTQEMFNAMADAWIANKSTQDPSAWSAEARAWAEKAKLVTPDVNGNLQYKKPLTREEFVTVLYRQSKS